jgi:hypothetical protein
MYNSEVGRGERNKMSHDISIYRVLKDLGFDVRSSEESSEEDFYDTSTVVIECPYDSKIFSYASGQFGVDDALEKAVTSLIHNNNNIVASYTKWINESYATEIKFAKMIVANDAYHWLKLFVETRDELYS